jgi:hypothetical protein
MISSSDAASASGGEFLHRSSGFIIPLSLSVLNISSESRRCSVSPPLPRADRYFCRLRAFANQVDTCVRLNPVLSTRAAFSCFFGYGLSACWSNHCFKICTAARLIFTGPAEGSQLEPDLSSSIKCTAPSDVPVSGRIGDSRGEKIESKSNCNGSVSVPRRASPKSPPEGVGSGKSAPKARSRSSKDISSVGQRISLTQVTQR